MIRINHFTTNGIMIVITLIIIYYIQHNKYMFVNSDKTRNFLLQVRASGEDEKKREREK